jgi:hypothetical protein
LFGKKGIKMAINMKKVATNFSGAAGRRADFCGSPGLSCQAEVGGKEALLALAAGKIEL